MATEKMDYYQEVTNDIVSSILEDIYAKHNADDRPSGKVMPALSMSDGLYPLC